MSGRAKSRERLRFLADVVTREASNLAQTDGRLFAQPFGPGEVASLTGNADLAERVDAFVARFGRLQDTLAGALLPRLLLVDALQAAHRGVADLTGAATAMVQRVRGLDRTKAA